MPRLVVVLSVCGRSVLFVLGLALAATLFSPAAARAAPPKALYIFSPPNPITGQEVTFTSKSTPDSSDPARTIVQERWDFDNDGQFDDASGRTVTWTFARPGQYRVGLLAVDSAGESDTSHGYPRIGNRHPVPLIGLVPASPTAGQPVALLSNSYDPDGTVVKHEWDLDGDGAFDDATGSYVSTSFAAGGRAIGLRVTDDSGASEAAVATIQVPAAAAAPASGPGARPGSGPVPAAGIQSIVRVLSPFPVVRVAGIVQRQGITLRLLSVSGPIGARVSVRCRGRGCPFRKTSSVVKAQVRSTAAPAPTTGFVAIRRFGQRLLRAGATIKVFVTRPDAIGKYTRLKVRRSKAPDRLDRCVTPAFVPLDCPTG